jgi:hypothetical protein
MVNMNNLTGNPLKGLLCYFVYEIEGWTMVVRPVVRRYSPLKKPLFIVGFSLGCVNDPIVIAMFLVQEKSHLNY